MFNINQCKFSGTDARGVSKSCMMTAKAPVLAGAPVQDSAGDTGALDAIEYLSGIVPPSWNEELLNTNGVRAVPGLGG
jgi:hypothetical protein